MKRSHARLLSHILWCLLYQALLGSCNGQQGTATVTSTGGRGGSGNGAPHRHRPSTAASTYYKTGDFVNDFSLKNIDGRRVSVSDYSKQKGLVIVFMRNTCEYCQAYEGRIIKLARKYGPIGYPLLAISPFGDDPKNNPLDDLKHMKILAKTKNFGFPYLSDEKLRITTLFNDQYTPAAYVLQNIQGKMKIIYGGDIDNDWQNTHPKAKRLVERALDSLIMHSQHKSPNVHP